jgi:hypothetical protein
VPGEELQEVWVHLATAEADELQQALAYRAANEPDSRGWHHHILDSTGRELTVAVGGPDEAPDVP